MKNIYVECLLTIIALFLVMIAISVYHIERSLLVDFRPVRTTINHIQYDVAECENLTIIDEPGLESTK